MSFQKNEWAELLIEDCGIDGEGIGKTDGFTLFVKDAVIGDYIRARIIKVKKNYGYGRLEEVLTASPYRVEPECPIARPCGGCQLQALRYDRQLVFKEEKVRNNLKKLGGFEDPPMEPIIGAEHTFRYRNKAQYPVGKNREGRIIAGFYAGRTHAIIETEDCILGMPENKEILRIILSHMEKHRIEPYDEETGKGLVRHILIRVGHATGQIMVCLVVNGEELPGQKELCKALCTIPGMTSISLNVNRQRNNVILGETVILLYGKPAIEDRIGDLSYRISARAFYQVNAYQTVKLYNKVLEYAALTGEETVWDLYCGIGTISLFLARRARKVYGVEVIPEAIENARENAALNQISNAEFITGKAEDILPEKVRRNEAAADVIVVDPPRKGCERALLDAILQIAPRRIIYVSCESATLARDLKILCEKDYHLEKVCPTDQFPQTIHVETVVCLSNKNAKSKDYVEIGVDAEDYYRIKDSGKDGK